MSASIFAAVEMAPRDPILGLNEAFAADTRAEKVNLGVGVYYDDNGKIPLLAAVRAAEKARLEAMPPRGYQPIEGPAAYNNAVQGLLFGKDSQLATSGQTVTIEALGGTGALKVGADYLKRLVPGATVYISDPSWENHRALFESAGFPVENYPYYDAASRGVNFAAMKAKLDSLQPGSVIVLHACCHNPTGADLSDAQWDEVVAVCRERGLIPFLDMAYQGFAEGIDADAVAVRALSSSGLQFFVSSSFSKSFSLYGERVGALSIVTASKEEAGRVRRRARRHARAHPRDAHRPRRSTQGRRRGAGLLVRDQAARHVLVHWPDCSPGRDAQGRLRYLRRIDRPHLPGRAQLEEHRLRRQGDRTGGQGLSPIAPRRRSSKKTLLRLDEGAPYA